MYWSVHVSDPSFRRAPDKDQLLELIIDSAKDFAIFSTDLHGLVTSWNIGAERLFQWTDTEIVGLSADEIFTSEDRANGIPDKERAQASADGRALDERWHRRKDSSHFWASGLLMPLKHGAGFIKIARDRTEQHRAEEQPKRGTI
jgi:PAS domain S-box-containing protein